MGSFAWEACGDILFVGFLAVDEKFLLAMLLLENLLNRGFVPSLMAYCLHIFTTMTFGERNMDDINLSQKYLLSRSLETSIYPWLCHPILSAIWFFPTPIFTAWAAYKFGLSAYEINSYRECSCFIHRMIPVFSWYH